jgi:hypothetical protein
MSRVRFSVVIPTRERADTLRFTLRTCLDQAFDDYEVIVSDNCSSPATKAVVDECASPKVRYVRTAEPVAMSTNWEFAVAEARGEYVTVLGDDDGLLPHALAELDRLVRAHAPKALRWMLAFYTWPTFIVAGHENYLRIPFGNRLVERAGAEVIKTVIGDLGAFEELPMVYNAIVRHDVLDDLRRRTGRVFPHPIPDVYSGFAVAHAAGRFLSTEVPMSLRGLSGSSNGIAALFDPGRTAIEQEYHALNAKDGLYSEPRAPNLPVLAAYIADAFLYARRALFPDSDAHVDRRQLARICVQYVRAREADWPMVLAAVRRSLTDDPELVAWFDAECAGAPYVPPGPTTYFRPDRLGFDGKNLHLDAAACGVADVAGAARLCERLLNFCGHDVRYTSSEELTHKVLELVAYLGTPGQDSVRWALGWERLLDYARLLQSERNTIEAVSAERAAIIFRADAELRALDERLRAERRWSLKRPVRALKRALAALRRSGAGKPTASA